MKLIWRLCILHTKCHIDMAGFMQKVIYFTVTYTHSYAKYHNIRSKVAIIDRFDIQWRSII